MVWMQVGRTIVMVLSGIVTCGLVNPVMVTYSSVRKYTGEAVVDGVLATTLVVACRTTCWKVVVRLEVVDDGVGNAISF